MTLQWFSAPAPVARKVRAYFAPVNRPLQSPVLFDASEQGGFSLDSPPAPWISLGRIQEFARKTVSKTSPILTGIPAATLEQVRETIQAHVSFQFLSWTKLTMALAAGSQHMNLLKLESTNTQGTGGTRVFPAITPLSGSTAGSIVLSSADATKFVPGSMIAVDDDYAGETGYVGSPVSGSYLRQPVADVDYIRRVTFNVALVSEVNSTGLILAEPLPGGAPGDGAKLQPVCGFADREGGSFFQEWSALFVVQGSQGERVFFHYPRLQNWAGAEEASIPLASKYPSGLARLNLKAQYLALPVTDHLDGERVVCYRSFLPANRALV